MSEWMDQFKQDLETLRQVRDEIRVQLHIGKADAKDRWHKLEDKWIDVEGRMRDIGSESFHAISDATKRMMGELKRDYEELRDALKE